MITVNDLAKRYGGQTLFQDVQLQLNKGQRIGIVGANGSGKSTLLRILADQETASEGQVIRVKSATVGMLDQDHFAYENTPIIDVVMMGNKVLWDAIVEKEAILERAGEHFDEDRYVVVFGEVIGIHIQDELITEEGLVDVGRMRPLGRLGYNDYTEVDSNTIFTMVRPD